MSSKIALVFPGQGSQSVGMLAELAAEFSSVRETFSEASSILGYDLWQIAQTGPEEKLNQTEYAQPILLTADLAVWRAFLAAGGNKPSFLAGHSLGEYAALVAAESLSFADALRLTQKRAQLMQAAVPLGKGAMLVVVGLEDDKILQICAEAAQGEVLSPANYNSPQQIVLAGVNTAVARAAALAQKANAKLVKILAVSVPSHCALMRGAAEALALELEKIELKEPQIAVIHNADVKSYQEPVQIRDVLVRQLYSPVRWIETIELFVKENCTAIIECGPGKVLTGLNKRIAPQVLVTSLHMPEALRAGLMN
jgi:[acyl-carrier-protein] S-malonyltransferase